MRLGKERSGQSCIFNTVTQTIRFLKIQSLLFSSFLLIFFQWNVFQYPFQRRVVKAIQFLRETGREIIEARKNAMKRGGLVPDDILQHIIKLQGLLALSFRD